MIKENSTKPASHVARMEENEKFKRSFTGGDLREGRGSKDVDLDGRILR